MKNRRKEPSWVLSFRVNHQERQQIEQLARRSRMNISEYIRKQMLDEGDQQGGYRAADQGGWS